MSADPNLVLSDAESARLIAEMRPALIRYFERRCGKGAEAEDLAQEVIARALAKSGWDSADRAKGYVFRIAANLWNDRGRRLMVRGVPVELDCAGVEAAHEEISPERVSIAQEELQRVVAALGELGERTRDIFVLYRLECMKQADIAAMFGVSVSSIEKDMAKALAHLARRLDHRKDNDGAD